MWPKPFGEVTHARVCVSVSDKAAGPNSGQQRAIGEMEVIEILI